MTSSDEYYYNEHDVNQVHKIYKKNKKKKLKRRVKILLFLVAFTLIGWYFLSDYSKVQSIQVIGNEYVLKEDVLNKISVNKNSFHVFVSTSQIEKEVRAMPMIKKASVTKDLFGHIKIELKEADKVAYCVIRKNTYVIDELGDIAQTNNKDLIRSLQSCPQITKFTNVKFLKTFAKEYVRIPELIKNETSDIVYEPKQADETRLKFVMNNGKILYLRVEDMVDQLSRFDYEANMTAHKDKNVFSFEGNHVYMHE